MDGLGFSSSLTRDCLNFKVPKSNCYMMRPAERADRRPLVNIYNQPEELNANKLAAKAMKRKLKEADNSTKQQDVGSSTRYVVLDLAVHKKKDDDGDLHLAQKIMQNKQNTISGQADDEYDFEDCPIGKSWKKRRGNDNNASEKAMAKRICTQQERCLFCFENPNRPRHLVVAIANFTYLMLPRWEPVVPGHCCILPVERTDQESCFHREKRDPPPENPTGPPPEKRVTFSEREERPHQTNPTSRFQRERRETPPQSFSARNDPTSCRHIPEKTPPVAGEDYLSICGYYREVCVGAG